MGAKERGLTKHYEAWIEEAKSRGEIPHDWKEPKRRTDPLSGDEIERMPKWLQEMGIRVGFLEYRCDRLIERQAAETR